MPKPVPYLTSVTSLQGSVPPDAGFPFNLPLLKKLNLTLKHPVVFLVGENGSGKSTFIEALAVLCGFPVSGGSRNELADRHGPEESSTLANVLKLSFHRKPHDGYFLRAEFQAHFASLLDARENDPYFVEDPYRAYGGKSLHERSHGEAFLAVLQNRIGSGLFLLDEPEAALSPQRLLALLTLTYDHAEGGQSQFIIATHSPILMTYPGAQIISFDCSPLRSIALEETDHYKITKGILENPTAY